MESITLGKNWEEIKDSLHLKLCNSDIHTSVSHFMDIQQKDNESLAAYIHRFKREAKNVIVPTMQPPSGHLLKNTHTLAAHVYEKGPRTLTDAISEVENFKQHNN